MQLVPDLRPTSSLSFEAGMNKGPKQTEWEILGGLTIEEDGKKCPQCRSLRSCLVNPLCFPDAYKDAELI